MSNVCNSRGNRTPFYVPLSLYIHSIPSISQLTAALTFCAIFAKRTARFLKIKTTSSLDFFLQSFQFSVMAIHSSFHLLWRCPPNYLSLIGALKEQVCTSHRYCSDILQELVVLTDLMMINLGTHHENRKSSCPLGNINYTRHL